MKAQTFFWDQTTESLKEVGVSDPGKGKFILGIKTGMSC